MARAAAPAGLFNQGVETLCTPCSPAATPLARHRRIEPCRIDASAQRVHAAPAAAPVARLRLEHPGDGGAAGSATCPLRPGAQPAHLDADPPLLLQLLRLPVRHGVLGGRGAVEEGAGGRRDRGPVPGRGRAPGPEAGLLRRLADHRRGARRGRCRGGGARSVHRAAPRRAAVRRGRAPTAPPAMPRATTRASCRHGLAEGPWVGTTP